jgi:ectoine hydroxylase-related dioxygenase (phytanoyl-CoA dioxygenase family)
MPSFAELSELPDPKAIPVIDRPETDERSLSEDQLAWRRDGVVIKRAFLPDALVQAYVDRRMELASVSAGKHMAGWETPTPYEHVPELRALCLYPPLMRLMADLVGEEMLLHLNLTGWVSTERNWHQDDYLNPPHVNGWYAAVWMALGTIHDDAGPFEYIPGSHRYRLLRQSLVKRWMSPAELARRTALGTETWPTDSERFVVPAIEAEIAARAPEIRRFTAERGDILVWHGRLMHRGTRPTRSGALRPALIAHYSGIGHRPDMARRAVDANGCAYAVFGLPLV